jgi:hypothetical protein
MVEVWLFGRLVATLASAFAVVLLLVALTSVTYLSFTLIPALRAPDHRVRRLGVGVAAVGVLLALFGLRVGPPGSGGEIVPTLALAVAAATALGSSAALSALGAARAVLALGSASRQRRALAAHREERQARRLDEARRGFLAGDDLRDRLAEADAAVGRLRAGLRNLEATRADVEHRLARLDPEAAGDLPRELRRAREEVATKLELGGKILRAAEAAAFRIAAVTPVARLLRARPREVAEGLSGDVAALPARLTDAAAALDAFLARAAEERTAVEALAARRPADLDDHDDPVPGALRDVDAVAFAFAAVRERIEVARVRLAARADLDAVAGAAGEVSARAHASGLPADDLQELVAEVMRAESAILMATPGDMDTAALTATVGRGTAALGGRDGASLDELLQALREIA